MNRYKYIVLPLVILLSLPKMQSPPNVEWSRFYGGSEFDVATSIIETNGGDFVILGTTYSYGSGYSDVYLFKVNNIGDTLWTKTYGGNMWDYGNSMIETSDNGYIIAGATSSYGAPSWNMYIVRTDQNGDTLWTKTFQNSYDCFAQSIIETSDGGFLAVGYESWDSPGGGGGQDYLVKIDSDGNLQWSNSYIGGVPGPMFTYSFGTANDVCETSSGDYLIIGGHDYDLTILKINSTGDSISTKIYPNRNGFSITNTQDGYAISGTITDTSTYDQDMLLLICNESGDTIFSRDYDFGEYDRGSSVITVGEDGYAILGTTGDYYYDQSILVRTDANGNLLWNTNLNVSSNNRGKDLVLADNMSFYLVGYTQIDSTQSNGDIYLVKFESELSVINDVSPIPTNIKLSSNYPNPFNNRTIIPFSLTNNSTIHISIVNELGQVVYKTEDMVYKSGGHQFYWDTKQLPSGVYFFQINNDTEKQTIKCTLIK